MFWDQLTSKQLGACDRNIPVLLLLAATEQHGPHLPLSTDRLIGEHFLSLLNDIAEQKILILPTLSIGCSGHHMDFAGTLTLSHVTFLNVIIEIVHSVIQHGFKKIILFNSHGGNQAIGQVALEKIGDAHPGCMIVLATWWVLAHEQLRKITKTEAGGTGHACEFETSLIHLAAPSLVLHNMVEKGDNENTFSWAEGDMLNGPKAAFYRSTKSMTANGIYGDPTKSSKEQGIEITETVVNELVKLVRDVNNAS